MKQAIVGMGLTLLLVLLGCIVTSLGMDAAEQGNLEHVMSLATYQSLTESIERHVDVQQCFQNNLSEKLDGRTYSIDELIGDSEFGILSATVTVTYVNWGYERQVTCRRSVIYERDRG